jgi:hypothetical protein
LNNVIQRKKRYDFFFYYPKIDLLKKKRKLHQLVE